MKERSQNYGLSDKIKVLIKTANNLCLYSQIQFFDKFAKISEFYLDLVASILINKQDKYFSIKHM